ncbi:MAG: radical SAM protein, partial [Lachnospiraceae bacterium]|nr:radical SAM protein [Lachnospiraceae bacterium]
MEHVGSQEYLEKFASLWPMDAPYYIWGTSNTARKVCQFFEKDLHIVGFIDSDHKKWKTQFLDCSVFSPNEALVQKEKIIVASQAYLEIKSELEHRGLVENEDFCDSRYFVTVHQWLSNQRVHIRRTDLSITSYCNLRCRHCNMLMPYYKEHCHYASDKILASVDSYFQWVDYVEVFNILGGEPFLHPQLYEIVQVLGSRYRSKIGALVFFSNGTIIPDEKMLSLMQKYQIKVYIGDYRIGLPELRPKVDAFVRTLEDAGLGYDLAFSDTWLDFNHT